MKCEKCNDTGFIVKLLDKPLFTEGGIFKDREFLRCSCDDHSYAWFDKNRIIGETIKWKQLACDRKHEIDKLNYTVENILNRFEKFVILSDIDDDVALEVCNLLIDFKKKKGF